MTFDPHIATIAVVTLCVGWFMAVVGIHKSALEWKRRRRVCPSCGRDLDASGYCNCS